jgi:hypothetical protein
MKTKMVPVVSTALLLSAIMYSIASAQGIVAVNVHANVNASVELGTQGNATSATAKEDEHANATSTNASASGQLTAQAHRSTVAAFVQSLLNVATREGGIGAQVRAVANSQSDSASTSAAAITKVEHRSKLLTLFFGSDYKSLGQLRSEMVTTQNNIDQLNNLLTQASSDADKAELSAQISVLEDSQATIDAYVTAHENSFSFFGWFTKWFAK